MNIGTNWAPAFTSTTKGSVELRQHLQGHWGMYLLRDINACGYVRHCPRQMMHTADSEHDSVGSCLKGFHGRILMAGLGMGLFFKHLTTWDHLDIVEVNADVIDLIWPHYQDIPNVTLHQCDIWNFRPGEVRPGGWDYMFEDTDSVVPMSDEGNAHCRQDILLGKFQPHVREPIRFWLTYGIKG